MKRFGLLFCSSVCLALSLSACDLGDKDVGTENDSGDMSTDSGDAFDPCEDKTCGMTCSNCLPGDDACAAAAVVMYCDPDGACGNAEPVCEDPDPYDPCEGLSCGDTCTQCDPNDPTCVETEEVKTCDDQGACVSGGGPVECAGVEPYEPCAGLSCGQTCTQCDPTDVDCVETAVEKACTEEGTCVADDGMLCPPYEPCAGLICGDPCSQCDPNDPDCVETAEEKACNEVGVCVSAGQEMCA